VTDVRHGLRFGFSQLISETLAGHVLIGVRVVSVTTYRGKTFVEAGFTIECKPNIEGLSGEAELSSEQSVRIQGVASRPEQSRTVPRATRNCAQ
jgi:hypothetical protein